MKITRPKHIFIDSIGVLKFVFSAIVIFLIIASFFTYNTFLKYNSNVELRINSHQMIRALKGIEIAVIKAESGHRGYQLTRDPEYLEPYELSRETIYERLNYLDSLSLDVGAQELKIDSLTSLVTRQYAIIEEIINEKETEESFSQYEMNLLALGGQNLEQIRLVIRELERKETQILNERVSAQETKGRTLPILLTLFNILALIIIIYVFFYIYKLLKQKTLTEEQLRQRQDQLIEAERMVNIGNWSWDMENEEVEWSEGLYQIYDKNPSTYTPDIHSFSKYVHPDDRNKVMATINEAIKNKKAYSLNYRIQLDDGSIRYAYVIGTPKINVEGERTGYYGVTQDITAQKNAENKILMQSEELKRSNEDLEQFAYVASHDLQEPLRKIRAFGDRLETKFKSKLEGDGADYISRMKNASERMQDLIDDLLTYSRVSRGEQELERHSLDDIVDEVLDDMEATITENKARIDREGLPEIECNFREMKRLFQNIISNAIKFRQPKIDPVITIHCTLQKGYELENEFPVKGNKQYYRISVMDNGIGFDKKYQERIFTIFQRLHGRGVYSGTGIGLAICRKIVNNHNGYIRGIGNENEGAEFIILLPKIIKKSGDKNYS